MKKISIWMLVLAFLAASVLTALAAQGDPWDCPAPGCGRKGNTGNYCVGCGQPAPWLWDCPVCGQKGNTGNYCEGCGQPAPWLWDCPVCGQKGNTGNFCPACGNKVPEKWDWDCPACGQKGNTGNFCPNCGYKGLSSEVTSGADGKSAAPGVKVGDYVTFGHYEQDNDKSNGKEPIEWLVLAKEGNKVLLISRYGLDEHCYHKNTPYPTWAKSDIRAWLNGTFLNAAFTAEEQAGIVTTTVSTPSYNGHSGGADTQDRIWLLSREEAEEYFSGNASRKAVPTAFAVAQGVSQFDGSDIDCMLNGEGCCWWWLRSPGNGSNFASYVYGDGSLYNYLVHSTSDAVRPAFWLNLDSGIF